MRLPHTPPGTFPWPRRAARHRTPNLGLETRAEPPAGSKSHSAQSAQLPGWPPPVPRRPEGPRHIDSRPDHLQTWAAHLSLEWEVCWRGGGGGAGLTGARDPAVGGGDTEGDHGLRPRINPAMHSDRSAPSRIGVVGQKNRLVLNAASRRSALPGSCSCRPAPLPPLPLSPALDPKEEEV